LTILADARGALQAPFTSGIPLDHKDQQAGYVPHLSIWQLEFSLTQVLDRMLRHAHLQN
jgi:hypothetical protein